MGSVDLPQKNEVKYLDMHLDRRLTWAKHIIRKRLELKQKAKNMHWLLGGTRISIESRVLLYKAVLRLIWTYGIQLWGKSSNSNNEKPPTILIQNYPIHSERTLVQIQQQDP
jgi:hypothetical protein